MSRRFNSGAASGWLVLVTFLVSACGGSDVGSGDLERGAAVMSALGSDRSVDYEPLTTPLVAVKTADLIVTGEVVDISEGLAVVMANDPWSGEPGDQSDSIPEVDRVTPQDAPPASEVWMQFTTLSVLVDSVIKGDDDLIGDTLPVQVARSPVTTLEEVTSHGFRGPIVLLMTDESDWVPFPDAELVHPPELGVESTLYVPLTDGVWVDTADGPRGPEVVADELDPAWGSPGTIEDIATALANAG